MMQHVLELIEQTRIKLILFSRQHSERAPPEFHAFNLNETIEYIANYPTPDHEHPLKGAYYLSVLYYKSQGSYRNNARFLFGTASQFCT